MVIGIVVEVGVGSNPRKVFVIGDQKMRIKDSASMIVKRKKEKKIHQLAPRFFLPGSEGGGGVFFGPFPVSLGISLARLLSCSESGG